MTRSTGYTAAEEVLLAAAELSGAAGADFSEWDLTVATWKRNRNKFGCRGYEEEYPDHKRVMMEIMSKAKKDNPLRQAWIEKTKPNYYRATFLGQAAAEKLRHAKGDIAMAARSPEKVYDAVVSYINHRVFRDYCRDSAEPRTWLGASAFLGLSKDEATHLNDRTRAVENATHAALEWLEQSHQDTLTRGPSGGGITVRRSDLEMLREFVSVLQNRFRVQIGAIRNRHPKTVR